MVEMPHKQIKWVALCSYNIELSKSIEIRCKVKTFIYLQQLGDTSSILAFYKMVDHLEEHIISLKFTYSSV